MGGEVGDFFRMETSISIGIDFDTCKKSLCFLRVSRTAFGSIF